MNGHPGLPTNNYLLQRRQFSAGGLTSAREQGCVHVTKFGGMSYASGFERDKGDGTS